MGTTRMTAAHHELAASALRDAYAAGAIPPLRAWLEPTDVVGAYAVQAINTRLWEAQGRRIVGRKAGLIRSVGFTESTAESTHAHDADLRGH